MLLASAWVPESISPVTGSARVAREAKDASQALFARQEMAAKQCALDRKRKAIIAQIDVLRLELDTEEQESRRLVAQEQMKLKKWQRDQGDMAKSRAVREGPVGGNTKNGKPREVRR